MAKHTLYERAVTDISIDWRQPPMPPIQPPPIRHLLATPDASETLCGHRVAPPDVIGEYYADPGSVECRECARAS